MTYTPKRGVFAQSQYFDQQGSALPGMLAHASDINLVDSGFVGGVSPVTGLTAGVGVIERHTVRSNRPGFNYDIYDLPTATTTADDFGGIVVRNQFMNTNSAGEACYFFEDMCNVLSARRIGGRVWVNLASGSTSPGSTVHWIVRDTAGTGKPIGAFSGAPINGVATATAGRLVGGTANVNEIKSLGSCGFDITAATKVIKLSGLNFSGVATLAETAAILQTALNSAVAAILVTVMGNSIVFTTATTGAAATLSFAVAPTTASTVDASNTLGLTAAAGGVVADGSAGASLDTVPLVKARFLDTFSAGAGSNLALVEIL